MAEGNNAHDGERLVALAAAERLLGRDGLRLRDLPALPAPEPALPELGMWRATCRQCLTRRHLLRAWEAGFLTDLQHFRRLAVKQRYCLAEIAARVLKDQEDRRAEWPTRH
ncbi:MAG: hypothetical protein M0002_18835 [Rhodospirillales bacterium]|nr:hypothetical protein [Rhodospirillales bacterium]